MVKTPDPMSIPIRRLTVYPNLTQTYKGELGCGLGGRLGRGGAEQGSLGINSAVDGCLTLGAPPYY